MLSLMMLCLIPSTAYGASAYAVEKVDVSVELRSDGRALVTEEWTVDVGEDCKDSFARNIVISEDNFEHIAGVSDLSVSLDGNICMEEAGDVLRDGTYFYTASEDMYCVNWYIPQPGKHVFSLRYIQSGAVKIYKDRAYYYFCAADDGKNIVCRNVTVKISTPSECYAENFEIVESGSLAGEKSDGKVTFFASNTAGAIKTGIAMPNELFDPTGLVLIEDDNRGQIAAIVIFSVMGAAVIALSVYFALKYKKVLRNSREKYCSKKILDEPMEKLQRRIFECISPAQLLNTVLDGIPDESDYFTVTVLDLYQRGYITASSEGFASSEKSLSDSCGRKLSKNEKRVIRLFDKSRWEEIIKTPKMFYNEITEFNKNVSYLSPVNELSGKGRRLIHRCFELKLNAGRAEYVSPQEISDNFFKNSRYTTGDLVMSVINEYSLMREGNTYKPENEDFVRNLFMFRDIYAQGRKMVIDEETERKLSKEKR